jgi:DNA-directed RNA polymerase specialized sigma24 family protein
VRVTGRRADAADDLLKFDDALACLRAVDPPAAGLVEFRFFAGLTMPESAAALGVPLRTAGRDWTFARAWLHRELADRPAAGD